MHFSNCIHFKFEYTFSSLFRCEVYGILSNWANLFYIPFLLQNIYIIVWTWTLPYYILLRVRKVLTNAKASIICIRQSKPNIILARADSARLADILQPMIVSPISQIFNHLNFTYLQNIIFSRYSLSNSRSYPILNQTQHFPATALSQIQDSQNHKTGPLSKALLAVLPLSPHSQKWNDLKY